LAEPWEQFHEAYRAVLPLELNQFNKHQLMNSVVDPTHGSRSETHPEKPFGGLPTPQPGRRQDLFVRMLVDVMASKISSLLEMVINPTQGNMGSFGNLTHRGRVIALLEEEADGGILNR
jgi:hypothetical protein